MEAPDLRPLKGLSPQILKEVIREGELMLQAQLAAATAADQRALTWTGFLITLATATSAAAASLAIGGSQKWLAIVAGLYAALLVLAASQAVLCFRPRDWGFPGNLPSNWLPKNWSSKDLSMSAARIEQAAVLEDFIRHNRAWAKTSGDYLGNSIRLTLAATFVAAVFVLARISWAFIPTQ